MVHQQGEAVVHVDQGDPERPERQNAPSARTTLATTPTSITRRLAHGPRSNTFDTKDRPLPEGTRPRLSLTGGAALTWFASLVTYIL